MTSDRAGLRGYYAAVAPFYAAEMALRDDLALWRGLAEGARTILDLGCGGGRVARALAAGRRVVGLDLQDALLPAATPGFDFVQGDLRALPFRARAFDLAIAANDPFAHLLADGDRRRAVAEACRVADVVIIDALVLDPPDDARAADGLVRETTLPGGVVRREHWRRVGPHRYRTAYRYLRDGATLAAAEATVRAWSSDDPALAGRAVRSETLAADRPGTGPRVLLRLEGDPERTGGAGTAAAPASPSRARAARPARRS